MSKAEAQSLSLLSERVSHALRTPLGTCLGVLEDLLAGYELTADEIRDGRDAAKRIQGTLDMLRDIQTDAEEKRAIALAEVFADAGIPRAAISGAIEPVTILAAPNEMACAFRAVWRFLGSKCGDNTALRASVGENGGALEVAFSSPDGSAKDCESIRALAKIDQSLEAVGLVFAEVIAAEHGATLSLASTAAGLLFELRGLPRG